MKRLLLMLIFAAIALSAIPAHAQVPVITNFYCVGTTYEVTGSFSCYVQMGPAYLIYAEEEVLANCNNGKKLDVAEDVFASCADNTPTASALGFVNWGTQLSVGRAIATAEAINLPGNPEETSTIDCYGVPGQAIQPIFSC